MARHNLVFLYGCVLKKPTIVTDDDGNLIYGMGFITVIRGSRKIEDNRDKTRTDSPIVLSLEPSIVKEMSLWDKGDIVEIKGTIATKNIKKTSECPNCNAKNKNDGLQVYVNPFFIKKRAHCGNKEEAMKLLQENKEISNQVFVFGTLVRDPKKITPKLGLFVTQYMIALNRKYRIRTDDPNIKTDYPWVKNYGERALEDKKRLHVGSEVYIDGCLQARSVNRHCICENCGSKYDWKDRALEIVPYSTEYIGEFYSDEEIKENEHRQYEQLRAAVLDGVTSQCKRKNANDDIITEQDIDAGFDVSCN